MATSTRTAQFTRLHKILKKHYTAVVLDANRTVLEHLLFASCLENAHYRPAEEAYAALVHTFYDWNEVRVSSIRELSEVIGALPDPAAAAHRVKRILQSVFEATYSFDLEDLRKQNLGPAVERLEKTDGTTKFSIAYVVQSALGGHWIPIDSGTANALHLVDLATEEDVAGGTIPGLDRAIAKNHGVEFGTLLHQLGADMIASPYSPSLHAILLEIEPKAKDLLPSRRSPKRPAKEPPPPAAPEEPGAIKGKKTAPEAKPHQKPAKPTPEAKAEARAEPADVKKELPHARPAAVAKGPPKEPAKEPIADAPKKPPTLKKKPAAEEPPPRPTSSSPAEPARKKESEAESLAAKKKPAPLKIVPTKKKPEEGKAKGPTDRVGENPGVDGISKRKPR